MGSKKDLGVIVYLSRVVSIYKLLSDLFRLPEMKKVFAHGHNVSETIIMIMYTLTI